MSYFTAKEGQLFCVDNMDIHIPLDYFDKGRYAKNLGSSIETFGILYVTTFTGTNPNPVKLWNIPTFIHLMLYSSEKGEITVSGSSVPVLTLKYIKGSFVMRQAVRQGREVAENFLDFMLAGKLPKCIPYNEIMQVWSKNLYLSGVSFRVPFKILEIIACMVYRNPKNEKQRFGELYGTDKGIDPLSYKTGNVRSTVQKLSTFSGLVFEDINGMITSGINNSHSGLEEPESPLEKIIYY